MHAARVAAAARAADTAHNGHRPERYSIDPPSDSGQFWHTVVSNN